MVDDVSRPATSASGEPHATLQERLARLTWARARHARKRFLTGLLFGQFLIIAMNLSVPHLVKLLPKDVHFEGISLLPQVVFVGIAVGAGGLVAIILAWMFCGVLLALAQGQPARGRIRTALKAALAFGVTAIVLIGTAFLMIPHQAWPRLSGDVRALGRSAWSRTHGGRVALPP